MNKVSIIIPVYKDANMLKMCIYALFKNTKKALISNVYIADNSNDLVVSNCINNLKTKYKNILSEELSLQEFIDNCKSKYILFLSQQCIISSNLLEKLIQQLGEDEISISPVTNKMIDLPKNYTYMQFNDLLESNFNGNNINNRNIDFDCLLVNKKKLPIIEITNYKKLCDDIISNIKNSKIAMNSYAFVAGKFDNIVDNELKRRLENIIFDKIDVRRIQPKFSFVTYLISIVQDSGGVHVAVDMVNYLIINGINCNILYNNFYNYSEIMLFNPIHVDDINECKIDSIMSTIYFSTYYAREIADSKNIPLIYFAQGYEPYFNNGIEYATAELSYKIADEVLCVSRYLQKCYKNNFNVNSTLITNGINYDLLYFNQKKEQIRKITLILRGSDLKGDFILMDVIKKIFNTFEDLTINVICGNNNIQLPFNDNKSINVNQINGPLHRQEIAKILQETDIYIDASLTEGFGLMALEAMAAGAVVIASNSGGNLEYLKDEINGLIVNQVNNADEYIEKLKLLLNSRNYYDKIRNNSIKSVKKYDFDFVIENYINYFKLKKTKKKIQLNKNEQKIYDLVLEKRFKVYNNDTKKSILRKIGKKMPKRLRNIIKKIVMKLYSFVNYD